jgi:hypothetical protein
MKKEVRCCEVTMLTKIKVCSSYKAQQCGEWAVMEVDRQWSLNFFCISLFAPFGDPAPKCDAKCIPCKILWKWR